MSCGNMLVQATHTRVSKIYLETRRGGIFLDGQTSFPGTSLPLKTCFNLLHEAATSSTERLQTLKTAVLVHFFWGGETCKSTTLSLRLVLVEMASQETLKPADEQVRVNKLELKWCHPASGPQMTKSSVQSDFQRATSDFIDLQTKEAH